MDVRALAGEVWGSLGADVGADRGEQGHLTITGPAHVLPSVFPVTALATVGVAVATLGAARVGRSRGGSDGPTRVAVDTRHCALACRSEVYLRAFDTDLGDIWDPIAGNYAAADGWIRLHTNFRHHRQAALATLGLGGGADRPAVAAAVARWKAVDLEDAVDAAGGCAAALRTVDEWRGSAAAAALATQPLVGLTRIAETPLPNPSTAPPRNRPLAGLRVLDLTRVLAGPVAGRFLAAYGADVLRVDDPAGEDGAVPVADTTVGKRATVLDLRAAADRERFEQLVAGAHVVLCGYRPGALAALGYGPGELGALRPGLVVATLSAYGDQGPWGGRRGFDSVVQMATGIADEGGRAVAADRPVPLPAQLLDHVTGYLTAAGVTTALARRYTGGGTWRVTTSLARTAGWLLDLPRAGALDVPPPPDALPAELAVDLHGPLGHTRHLACPGAIVGAAPVWRTGPVPLGHDAPGWAV
jgi:crotonobetainyl-CoA:carnitine CoA-transferase CaiB-like acyl-CoA transferase